MSDRKMSRLVVMFANSRVGQALEAAGARMAPRLQALKAKVAASPRTAIVAAVVLWAATIGITFSMQHASASQRETELEQTIKGQASQISSLNGQVSLKDVQISGLQSEKQALEQHVSEQQAQLQVKDNQIYSLSNPHTTEDIPWINRLIEWLAGIFGGEVAKMALKWFCDWLGSLMQH